MMNIDLRPETRRAIVSYANQEGMSFNDALEFLLQEGIKSESFVYTKKVQCG